AALSRRRPQRREECYRRRAGGCGLKAIEAATGIAVVLRKFEVHAVSEGEDAQGEARVYVEYNHKTYRGASVSTNIVESGTRAFLEVINRIELAQAGTRPREERSAAAPACGAAGLQGARIPL